MPWQEYMPQILLYYNAIPADRQAAWVEWITPQVEKSPLKIVTLFDLLWWINSSMQWQHVTLRILSEQTKLDKGMWDRTEHFFRSDDFQRWSCVESNHKAKLDDPNNWFTYKNAMRRFIFTFTNNIMYCERRRTKEKSQCLIPREDRTIVGVDSNFRTISWGAHCITLTGLLRRYGGVLKDFFHDVDDAFFYSGSDLDPSECEDSTSRSLTLRKDSPRARRAMPLSISNKLSAQHGGHGSFTAAKDANLSARMEKCWRFTHRRFDWDGSESKLASNQVCPIEWEFNAGVLE